MYAESVCQSIYYLKYFYSARRYLFFIAQKFKPSIKASLTADLSDFRLIWLVPAWYLLASLHFNYELLYLQHINIKLCRISRLLYCLRYSAIIVFPRIVGTLLYIHLFLYIAYSIIDVLQFLNDPKHFFTSFCSWLYKPYEQLHFCFPLVSYHFT